MTLAFDPAKVTQLLIENGWPADGIVAFQAAHNLTPDGIVGPKTWAVLNGEGPPPPSEVDPPPIQAVPDGFDRASLALVRAVGELQDGVREHPMGSNRGPRVDVYTQLEASDERPGPPWCAYFVSWCFRPLFRFGAVQSILDWAAKPGSPGVLLNDLATPQPGDIFAVVGHHVGLVRAAKPGVIWTVEGNSGNRVAARVRQTAGLAFVRVRG